MTCIVGLEYEGKVYIGGDSAGVAGYAIHTRADEKVFRNGDVVMGFTSSFRMGQLLRHAFHPPAPKVGEDIDRFMVTTFVDAVRDCLKAGGFAKREGEVETGGIFLVGYQGRLYYIGDDYQVGRAADGYDAVGSGGSVAMGALYATKGFITSPYARVERALEAAAHHNAGVRGPFTVVEL